MGEVLTAKHLDMSSKQPSDLPVMSQRLIFTEEEEFLLEMLNLARKLHALHHKARQKTYLLKCSHSVNQELKLPAVLLYTDSNLSSFGSFVL